MPGHSWGYTQQNGPDKWEQVAPAARGFHQSPINILPSQAEYDPLLCNGSIRPHYIPASSRTLVNSGHSVQVNVDGKGSGYLNSWLEGGPYRHKYLLEQFHFHWGTTDERGSEHLVNNKPYAAELHLVHWNVELFSTFGEAAKSANGLAVLAVFIRIGKEHAHLKKLTNLLPGVSYAEDSVKILGGFDPASILPGDKSKYYTYSGSLTTPPCYESIRFVIFKEPIDMSQQQLNAFRQLNTYKRGKTPETNEFRGKMLCNCRPTQRLNDRVVLKSFEDENTN